MSAYPADLYPGGCPCFTCDQRPRIDKAHAEGRAAFPTRMSLCPTCGSKRCPSAHDHRNACVEGGAS